jgi:DNA-binding Lrp family transcriptional regulator
LDGYPFFAKVVSGWRLCIRVVPVAKRSRLARLKTYHSIYEQIDREGQIPIWKIAQNIGLPRSTVSRYLSKMYEQKILVGPYLSMRAAPDYREYVYLANFRNPQKKFLGLSHFPSVIVRSEKDIISIWNVYNFNVESEMRQRDISISFDVDLILMVEKKDSEILVIAEGRYPSSVDHVSYSDISEEDPASEDPASEDSSNSSNSGSSSSGGTQAGSSSYF